jgi:hypothetical protein
MGCGAAHPYPGWLDLPRTSCVPPAGGKRSLAVCRVIQVSVRFMSKTLATWSEALRTEPPVSAAAVVIGGPVQEVR